jgi:ABC-type dipeptide/oligopeptide/nickel transport system permease component
MLRYILRRLLLLIPTFLVIYTITFLLIHATPGGPWNYSARPLRPEMIERLKEKYNLNDPLPKQYVDYLWGAVQGDFGPSYRHQERTVAQVIAGGFPISLQIGLVSLALAIIAGVPLGVISAVRHNSWVDYVTTFLSVVGFATPPYVSAVLFVVIFALTLRWFPTSGWDGLFSSKAVLPILTLSIVSMALFARYTRASMLDVLGEDYLRTARAKGLWERPIILRHALRNALIPVVTVGGVLMTEIIMGSFFVETIFALPGMGYYYVESVMARDFPLIMAGTLVYSVVLLLLNLVVDVSYAVLDPRVRYR